MEPVLRNEFRAMLLGIGYRQKLFSLDIICAIHTVLLANESTN